MRPDLILHIGQSKTGTSSIQRCLGARRAELRERGILYPRSPGQANHALLPASLVPVERLHGFNPLLWEGFAPLARLERFRREFSDEMRGMGPGIRRVIISAEQCGSLLTSQDTITLLRDLLAPHFGRIGVVMYLRRQDGHYASSYTQALRVAIIRAAALPEGGPETHPAYDYAAVLNNWAGVFGEAAVTPRIFEPSVLRGGDVVDDFFDFCGIDIRVPKDDPNRQSNRSITDEGPALVRAMGGHLERSGQGGLSADSLIWRRFVQMVSEAMPGRGWRPSPSESAAFVARFEASNEAVRRRWFPERARLFSVDDLKDAPPGSSAPAVPLPESSVALEAACALLTRDIAAGQRRDADHAVRVGRLQERLGDLKAARASYAMALRAEPDLALAHINLAKLDLAEGDNRAAERRLDVLKRVASDDPATARLARQLRRRQTETAINAAAGPPTPAGAVQATRRVAKRGKSAPG